MGTVYTSSLEHALARVLALLAGLVGGLLVIAYVRQGRIEATAVSPVLQASIDRDAPVVATAHETMPVEPVMATDVPPGLKMLSNALPELKAYRLPAASQQTSRPRVVGAPV